MATFLSELDPLIFLDSAEDNFKQAINKYKSQIWDISKQHSAYLRGKHLSQFPYMDKDF